MSGAGELFIGLMSGTSVDGVDAALVEFQSPTQLRVIETQFTRFGEELRAEINSLAQNNSGLTQCEDSSLHNSLATIYAKASLDLLLKAGVAPDAITGIANHGQTVRHEPNAKPAFSLQLGNAQMIANLTGIPCYAQFRQADLAAGGQGAPLMPAFHSALFNGAKDSLVLNIGGIANITQLGSVVVGFDTGPGNTLLDQWIHSVHGKSYDHDGQWAISGEVVSELLEHTLADPYFARTPPKSTGPDYFNLAWLGDVTEFKTQDVQATLLALTVTSIADAIKGLAGQNSNIFVCGGGAANTAMMHRLEQALPSYVIRKTDELGVPSDWVEAVGFAWLGFCQKHGIVSNLPSVTGASTSVVLGDVFTPQT